MNQQPLFIFDLDGTIALIDHRRHLIAGDQKDWGAFYRACHRDEPCDKVIRTMRCLAVEAELWIWTGRSDEVKDRTIEWLRQHTVPYTQLRMRGARDFRADQNLKLAWLEGMTPDDRMRLVALFEDRDSMVTAWRDRGLTCYQVAPGAY